MNNKYTQSKTELEKHFKETMQALELSGQAYDKGYDGEAKRLATAIRVLVHDINQSKSLLGQLELKDTPFYDTCVPKPSNDIITYSGLAYMCMTPQGSTYIAPLDNLRPDCNPSFINFDDWWTKVIFVDKDGNETTRKDLILVVANKDGGAHVDPVLDEKYANLSRFNSLNWYYSNEKGTVPLDGPEKAAIRQIAHEVLRSFNPNMPTMKPKIEGVIIGGMSVGIGDKPTMIPKVGRNDLCPCGSGKKYKRCHGMN